MTERVAIVGSREHPRLDIVERYVDALKPGTMVISGGARGVDATAEARAIARGLTVMTYQVLKRATGPGHVIVEMQAAPLIDRQRWSLPRGTSYRDALILRNTLIAVACTRMAAFVQGSRGGTWDAVRQAKRFGRPVSVYEDATS